MDWQRFVTKPPAYYVQVLNKAKDYVSKNMLQGMDFPDELKVPLSHLVEAIDGILSNTGADLEGSYTFEFMIAVQNYKLDLTNNTGTILGQIETLKNNINQWIEEAKAKEPPPRP